MICEKRVAERVLRTIRKVRPTLLNGLKIVALTKRRDRTVSGRAEDVDIFLGKIITISSKFYLTALGVYGLIQILTLSIQMSMSMPTFTPTYATNILDPINTNTMG